MSYGGYGPPPPMERSDQPGSPSGIPQGNFANTNQGFPVGTTPDVRNQVQDLNGLLGLYGPSLQLSNDLGQSSINSLTRQGLLSQASLQDQIDLQNQNAWYQQAGLGLQGQTLGVQQGALNRQMALLPQQYGIQQQQFGLQGQQIDLSRQQAWQNAQQQQQGLASQLTSSGNPYSVGGGIQRQQIQTGLANQLQGLDINQQQLGLQQKSAGLTYQEQLAQTQDAQKELGIQSQQLGLSGQEITSRLNNALDQLSLSGKISAEQVLQSVNQMKQGMVSPISGLIQTIINQTQLPLFSGQGGGQ